MARPLAKSLFVLLAVGLLIFASSASLAQDDDLGSLNQRIYKLFAEGKYQEAIPLAERAVGIATRVRGPEDPETATSLNNLGELYFNVYQYTKALAVLQEALRIRQKVLVRQSRNPLPGSAPDPAESLGL